MFRISLRGNDFGRPRWYRPVLNVIALSLSTLILCARGSVSITAAQLQSGQVYRITNACSEQVLDVSGISQTNGAAVWLWGWWAGENQKWQLTDQGDGTWQVMAKHSGQVLDVAGGATATGSLLTQWPWHGGANQRWQIADAGDGTVSFKAQHSGLMLDAQGSGTKNGTIVWQYPSNGSCAQQWKLELIPTLVVEPLSKTGIKLSWAAYSGATAYLVQRKDAAGSYQTIASLASDKRSYEDTGLSSGTSYQYRLIVNIDNGTAIYVTATQRPYSGPITITQGGTYSGNWENIDDASTPAVTVQTTEKVVIEKSYIRSKSIGIKAHHNDNQLTVREVTGQGLNPNVKGQANGCFLETFQFKSVEMTNNTLNDWGCGVFMLNYEEDKIDGLSDQLIRVSRNKIRNLNGKPSDGNGSYQLSVQHNTFQAYGGIMMNSILRADVEISWNEIINEPGKSAVEDIITTYNSGGKTDQWMQIHNNYVQGGYSPDITVDYGYAGCVFQFGDGPSLKPATGYMHGYDNHAVSFNNCGYLIGPYVSLHGNRAVSAQHAPNKQLLNGQWRSGFAVWNYYNAPHFEEVSVYDNYSEVMNRAGQANNWLNYNCAPGVPVYSPGTYTEVPADKRYGVATCTNNTTRAGWQDYVVPTNPVTTDDEVAEYNRFLQKVKDKKITLGRTQ